MRLLRESGWERRLGLYKSWGWSEDDVLAAFIKEPWCMMTSDDKIMAVMDFLVNNMDCEPSFIAKNPYLMKPGLKTTFIQELQLFTFCYRNDFVGYNNATPICNSTATFILVSVTTQMNEIVDLSDAEIELCKSIREEMGSAINSLLKDDGILVVPTTAYLPPKIGGKEILSEEFQSSSFGLMSIASLSGCCQVTVPLGYYNKCPISVSLIARHGSDRFLLDTVQTMYKTLQEQAETYVNSTLSNTDSGENSAEMAKEKGNQAFKEQKWQKAISYYNEAIKLNDKNATYFSNRAAAYLELGSFQQAEADCSNAINLDKKNVKAYLRRGTAREMLGYYKDAIEDFKYALVLEPTNKRASVSAERLRKVFSAGY
ncbi:Toc64 family protein [Salix suchowensis]|nr:Toc64 family protein [Salix suchowensis]